METITKTIEVPRYTVEQDTDSECPLEWSDERVVAVRIPRHSFLNHWDDPELGDVFWFFKGRLISDDQLQRTFERYLRLNKIEFHLVNLNSYGDRYQFYIFDCNKQRAEGIAANLEQWLDGNVYYVIDELTGESLGGIYADSKEDAIEQFKVLI